MNESRDKLLDQMQTHHTDIKLMAAINRVQRESAVLVKVSKLFYEFIMYIYDEWKVFNSKFSLKSQGLNRSPQT